MMMMMRLDTPEVCSTQQQTVSIEMISVDVGNVQATTRIYHHVARPKGVR